MARGAAAKAANKIPANTFILDNGAWSIKAGFAAQDNTTDDELLQACELIPNCIVRTADRKTFVATATNSISQWSEAAFRRPLENGQLVNWEAQKEIWDYSLFDKTTASRQVLIQEPVSTTLVLTEAPNVMPALQKNADEIIMEEWGFGGYLRTNGVALNSYNDFPSLESSDVSMASTESQKGPMESLLIIDSGYSSTTIVPCFEGKPIHRAVRRIDFGGKHLTNHLKETVSVRHFDLHQDTKIVNDIKEDTAFISQDFGADLVKAWKGNSQSSIHTPNQQASSLRLDYVLPDGVNILRGFARPHDPSREAVRRRKQALVAADDTEASMTLGNERFTVPEILFNPADIGSKQPGIVECIMQSLSKLPPLLQATMVANVVLVGGNAHIPGFVERLHSDLRSRIKTEWLVHVQKAPDPIKSCWLGGARLACHNRSRLQERAITQAQYQEYGSAWTLRKFNS